MNIYHQDTKAPSRIQPVSKTIDALGRQVVDAAFKVHCYFGPGLLESLYEEALFIELGKKGLSAEQQKVIPVSYYDVPLKNTYRIDLLVEDQIIIEVKSAEKHLPVYEAQLLTYMKLTERRLGYLINFNVPLIKGGIKRMVL